MPFAGRPRSATTRADFLRIGERSGSPTTCMTFAGRITESREAHGVRPLAAAFRFVRKTREYTVEAEDFDIGHWQSGDFRAPTRTFESTGSQLFRSRSSGVLRCLCFLRGLRVN